MLTNLAVGTKVRIVTDCRPGTPATGQIATYDGDLPRSIICTCGKERMRQKVYDALRGAAQGDLVVFLGDVARTCDGKILPHLNLVPNQAALILPRYREESKPC